MRKNKPVKYGIIIFALILLIGLSLKGNITHEPFDSEKWKNWTESEAEMSLRWEMMNSLRNTQKLKGKSKEEIVKLLGEPESITKTEYSYYLGMSGFGINTGSLTFVFNDEGKVIRFWTWDG